VRVFLLCGLLFLGCAKPSVAPVDAGAKAAVQTVEPDCSLTTPLVPGVPGSPGHLIPSERNPNGDSELAALMRRMQSEVETARGMVMKGEVPAPMYAGHRRIRCSWPTEAKDRDEGFDALAVNYLSAMKKLDAPGDKKAAFAGVVGACRACHERSCPGPLTAIEKLELPNAAPATP
jgi:hypothetical protein